MENIYRNEKLIKVGGQEILLRPTFENIAAMENDIGGLPFLAWKFSQSIKGGKNMPGLGDCAKVIFYNQAAVKVEDPTKKMLSLEEVWQLVSLEGIHILKDVITFLSSVAAGNRLASEPSEGQKKS